VVGDAVRERKSDRDGDGNAPDDGGDLNLPSDRSHNGCRQPDEDRRPDQRPEQGRDELTVRGKAIEIADLLRGLSAQDEQYRLVGLACRGRHQPHDEHPGGRCECNP
jgi:hypothetical protein